MQRRKQARIGMASLPFSLTVRHFLSLSSLPSYPSASFALLPPLPLEVGPFYSS